MKEIDIIQAFSKVNRIIPEIDYLFDHRRNPNDLKHYIELADTVEECINTINDWKNDGVYKEKPKVEWITSKLIEYQDILIRLQRGIIQLSKDYPKCYIDMILEQKDVSDHNMSKVRNASPYEALCDMLEHGFLVIASSTSDYNDSYHGFEYNDKIYITKEKLTTAMRDWYMGTHDYGYKYILDVLESKGCIKIRKDDNRVWRTHHCLLRNRPDISSKRYVVINLNKLRSNNNK